MALHDSNTLRGKINVVDLFFHDIMETIVCKYL
jgi:hypothetical protein